MHYSTTCALLSALVGLAQATPVADSSPLPRNNLLQKKQATNPLCGVVTVTNKVRNITVSVEAGDTLCQLATLFNTGVCDIAKQNSIANIGFIEVGQVLTIEINKPDPDNTSCASSGNAKTLAVVANT